MHPSASLCLTERTGPLRTRCAPSLRRPLALLAFALCALPCAAWAQGPTVDPGGAAPESPAPPPAAPQPPQTIIIPINPQTGQPLPTAPPDPQANADGFYHYDQGMGSFDQPVTLHAGPTPQLHVVRSGDTLWDICFYYFNDPWQWPKIWSYNEQITNPHWIYPGDLVRMVPVSYTHLTLPTSDLV